MVLLPAVHRNGAIGKLRWPQQEMQSGIEVYIGRKREEKSYSLTQQKRLVNLSALNNIYFLTNNWIVTQIAAFYRKEFGHMKPQVGKNIILKKMKQK